MFLLLRKGQFGEKLEKQVAIFLLFCLNVPMVQKAISYQPREENKMAQFVVETSIKHGLNIARNFYEYE